eukprot:scaffold15914_cov140-Skeletonema_marinoi.AAC.12
MNQLRCVVHVTLVGCLRVRLDCLYNHDGVIGTSLLGEDFGLVCLNIDIVSIFFPTSAEGREPGQLGSGKGTCLSVLSLLRPFFRTIIEIQRAIGWAGTPRLVASGGGRHRFRATGKDRAQFPGRNLGGFAKP